MWGIGNVGKHMKAMHIPVLFALTLAQVLNFQVFEYRKSSRATDTIAAM